MSPISCFFVIKPAGSSGALGISQQSPNPLIVMLFFPPTGILLKTKSCRSCASGVHVYVCAFAPFPPRACAHVSSILVIPHRFSLCV